MAKRGRKKKAGPRQPNGQLRRGKDYGTPELMEKRLKAVGKRWDDNREVWVPNDPANSECPLKVLADRGVITSAQVSAGLKFASRYRRAVGLTLQARGINFDDDTRGFYGLEESDTEKDRQAKLLAEYREVRAVLKAHSRQTLDAVMNVAAYERTTPYVEKLKFGLETLALHFGLTERRKEAA